MDERERSEQDQTQQAPDTTLEAVKQATGAPLRLAPGLKTMAF